MFGGGGAAGDDGGSANTLPRVSSNSTIAAMSHNATHTMDKESGAGAASSLWTILAAVALPLIFNALLEQSQSPD